MTNFNLSNFPDVCRLCLQAKPPETMLSTQNFKDENGSSLIDLLNDLSFAVPQNIAEHLPNNVCTVCYQVFEFVFKYKQKINMILKFMVAFVEVKFGNTNPLTDLFRDDNEYLGRVLKELNICDKEEIDAEDLLTEYHKYQLCSTPVEIKTEYEESPSLIIETQFLSKLKHMNPLEDFENDDKSACDMTEFLDVEFAGSEPTAANPPPTQVRKKVRPTSTPKLKHLKIEKSQYEFISMNNEEVSDDLVVDFIGVDDHDHDDDNDNDNDNDTVTEGDMYFESSDDDNDLTKESTYDSSNTSKTKSSPKKRLSRRGKVKGDLLQCGMCKFKTFFKETYENHMERHTKTDNKSAWKCKFVDCDVVFNSKDDLIKHKKDVHSKYICDVCGLVLKHKYTLEIHLRRHKGDSKYPCKYCATSYFTSNELKLHTSVVHMTTADFQCTSCGLSFKNKKSLILHERSHSEARNFQCTMCELAFKTSAHLRRHYNGVHRAIKYNCECCTMTYGRKDKLRMHMERAHNIQTYFTCDVCLKSFMNNVKLEEHKIHHKTPKELECGVCLAAYLSKDDFDNHLCITYRENYVCCERDFKYHLYYNKHMFLAHGLKTNARVKPTANVLTGCARAARKHVERCPKCDKTFATRKLKKEHIQLCGTELQLVKIAEQMLGPHSNETHIMHHTKDGVEVCIERIVHPII